MYVYVYVPSKIKSANSMASISKYGDFLGFCTYIFLQFWSHQGLSIKKRKLSEDLKKLA